MATNKLSEAQKLAFSGGTAGEGNLSNTLQVPVKGGSITPVQHLPIALAVSKGNSVCGLTKNTATDQTRHLTPAPAPVTFSGPQMPGPSVIVVSKAATPGGLSANSQQVIKPPALSQATTPGRTVVITVPRTGAPQPVAVAPRLQQTVYSHLPANIQIPPGMMLIRSDSGQLMLVSQQALVQAQQGPRVASSQASRILSHQVSAVTGSKSNEKVTVIRMAAPPSFLPAPIQKTAVVKVIGVAQKPAVVQTKSAVSTQENQPCIQAHVTETKKELPTTFSQETLESVKKCKNFLVTLIKLASSDSKSANMANNVRGLVRCLLEGKLEAEEFTEQLYKELKSTPQPCLVPFLKKSLPAVRCLTADPQLFILQASTSAINQSTPSPTIKPSISDTGQNLKTSKQVIQLPRRVILRRRLSTLPQSRNYILKSSRPNSCHTMSGKHLTGTFSMKQRFTQDPPCSTTFEFKDCSGTYKEEDDINDVAFMAGVNLREENAQILTTTMVGTVVQSCQDQLFLLPNLVLSRILHTGQALGVTDVGPEVIALVSHSTQECLRGLLEKLTVIAEHRKAALKEDMWHAKVSDVRSQLHFLEEVDALNKKKKDEVEREKLLHLARSRSQTEDPEYQQLKQKAKELQKIEEAQLQQREANLTALAAIGPRRKRLLKQTESQVSLLCRLNPHRVTRVVLRDLLVCMEQDHFLRHSLTLYKAMV